MTQSKLPVITIDGPSGSGKGTISKMLAEKLAWHFLDSGALYRVLAYVIQEKQLDMRDEDQLAACAAHLDITFKFDQSNNKTIIQYAGKDIAQLIRTEAYGMLASKISVYPKVRKALLARQRNFLQAPGLVADGRDMGTVVFPDACVKLFLTASLEERAKRRYQQLKQYHLKVTYENVLEDVTQRDIRDKERSTSPMVPADDAIFIDTTGQSIQQVFLNVLDKVNAIMSQA